MVANRVSGDQPFVRHEALREERSRDLLSEMRVQAQA